MAGSSEAVKDLFGDPWVAPRDPRGRKGHRRTPQIAEMVAVLKATGSKDAEIALRIGLSEPTLRKYYFSELRGQVMARQVLIERMWKAAMAGNVSAAKFVRDELAKGDAEAFLKPQPGERRSPPTPLGKKDQALLDAQSAGVDSDWGDDLKAPTVN